MENTLLPMSALEVMTAIHTGPGAIVTFHRKSDGKFLDVASLPMTEIRDQLPFISAHLKQDGYFSINSTFKQRHSRASQFGFTVYSRREKYLRWLNAVAVDLDSGHNNEKFDCATLRDDFLTEIEHSAIPVPSLICESGRGLWALWLLKDHRDDGRVPAHDRCRNWHKRIGQAIARRFAHLGADVRCHDCSRIMRFPGSINSSAPDSSQVVRFYRMSDNEYTLPEFGPHFGIVPRRISFAPRNGPRDTSKQAGGVARWANPLAGFRQLWTIRGGFSQGHRRNAVYLYALLLRINRQNTDRIQRECLKLAESCRPPVAPEEVAKRIAASRKVTARLRNDTFIRMLGITPAEVSQLPIWFKPYRQSVSQKIENRRDVLAQAIKSASRVFSVRETVLVLRAKGFKVSVGTACTDLQAVNLSVQKSMLEGNTSLSKFQHEKLNTRILRVAGGIQ